MYDIDSSDILYITAGAAGLALAAAAVAALCKLFRNRDDDDDDDDDDDGRARVPRRAPQGGSVEQGGPGHVSEGDNGCGQQLRQQASIALPPSQLPVGGGDGAQARQDGDGDRESDSACVVCFDGPKTHAAVPCGHQALCDGCVNRMLEQQREDTAEMKRNARTKRERASVKDVPMVCPMCRGEVSLWMKVFK